MIAVEVMRHCVNRAETVEFGDVFNFNRDAHKISWQASVYSGQKIKMLAGFSFQLAEKKEVGSF